MRYVLVFALLMLLCFLKWGVKNILPFVALAGGLWYIINPITRETGAILLIGGGLLIALLNKGEGKRIGYGK